MKTTTKKIAGVAGSAVLLAGFGMAAGTMVQTAVADQAAATGAEQVVEAGSSAVKVATVEGTFGFTQGEVSSNEAVVKMMTSAPVVLCSSDYTGVEGSSYADWTISVGGSVQNPYAATMGELEERGQAQVTMGCNCQGNPSDGLAGINAEVSGITLESIVEAAAPSEATNTIVFTSEDGYEVALPLSYVMQRYSIIVFALNGGELCDTVGGTNQLWLGSTSARYFVRNVSSITFEERDEAPAVPGSKEAGDTYANVPNIAVVYAS